MPNRTGFGAALQYFVSQSFEPSNPFTIPRTQPRSDATMTVQKNGCLWMLGMSIGCFSGVPLSALTFSLLPAWVAGDWACTGDTEKPMTTAKQVISNAK